MRLCRGVALGVVFSVGATLVKPPDFPRAITRSADLRKDGRYMSGSNMHRGQLTKSMSRLAKVNASQKGDAGN